MTPLNPRMQWKIYPNQTFYLTSILVVLNLLSFRSAWLYDHWSFFFFSIVRTASDNENGDASQAGYIRLIHIPSQQRRPSLLIHANLVADRDRPPQRRQSQQKPYQHEGKSLSPPWFSGALLASAIIIYLHAALQPISAFVVWAVVAVLPYHGMKWLSSVRGIARIDSTWCL